MLNDRKRLYLIISALLIVIMTNVSLSSDGYMSYMSNDDCYAMPSVQKRNSPELYPRDRTVSTLSRSYLTYYYVALHHLSRLWGVKTGCLVVHIFSRLLFFTSILLLSLSLFSKQAAAWITMFFFIVRKSLYGLTPTLSVDLHPQFLAVPILLIGLSFLFRKQIVIFVLFLTAALYIHATTAVWGILLGFFCWMGVKGYQSLRQSLIALALGAVLALPFLYQYLSSAPLPGDVLLDRQQIESLARWRIPFHIFPLSWNSNDSIRKLVMVTAIVALGYLGARNTPKLSRLLSFIVLGTAAIWAAGLIFTEVHYLPVMNKLQLLRSSSIQLILLSAFLAHYAWSICSDSVARKNYVVIPCLVLGAFYYFRGGMGTYQIVGIIFLAISFLIYHGRTRLAILSLVVFALYCFWMRLGSPKMKVAMLVLVLFLTYHQEVNRAVGKVGEKLRAFLLRKGMMSKAAASLILILVGSIAIYATTRKLVPYYRNSRTIPAPLQEAALWTKHNTPEDALFVANPAVMGFRYWAERSQLPDWKDGGIANYDQDYAVYYLEVMSAYGFYPGMNEGYLSTIPAETIISVGHKFGADYALLTNDARALPGEVVYENDKWQIVKLPQAKTYDRGEEHRELK